MTDPAETIEANPADRVSSVRRSRASIIVRRPRIDLGTRSTAAARVASSSNSATQDVDEARATSSDTSDTSDTSDVSEAVPAAAESRAIPRHWWGGDPFRTHFMDGFSSTLPFGEAFFVRAVRHYATDASAIDDPVLQDEIRRFAAQEGQHSRIHEEHVQLLLDQGYTALESQNRIFDRVMRWHNRKLPAFSLAVTTAVEHLTSILARQILEDRYGWLEDMDPEMAKLWRWHALEEAEHKSVAFDVLMQVAPSRSLRCFAMALNTVEISIEVFLRMSYMLWKDGLFFRGTNWLEGWRFLFGRRGFFRGTGSVYLAWYRADFHPNKNDDQALIDRYAHGIAAEALR